MLETYSGAIQRIALNVIKISLFLRIDSIGAHPRIRKIVFDLISFCSSSFFVRAALFCILYSFSRFVRFPSFQTVEQYVKYQHHEVRFKDLKFELNHL